jgi:hypothetical protein
MGLSVMQWRRWLLCGVDGVYGLDRRQGRIGPGLLRVAAGWALRKERRRKAGGRGKVTPWARDYGWWRGLDGDVDRELDGGWAEALARPRVLGFVMMIGGFVVVNGDLWNWCDVSCEICRFMVSSWNG